MEVRNYVALNTGTLSLSAISLFGTASHLNLDGFNVLGQTMQLERVVQLHGKQSLAHTHLHREALQAQATLIPSWLNCKPNWPAFGNEYRLKLTSDLVTTATEVSHNYSVETLKKIARRHSDDPPRERIRSRNLSTLPREGSVLYCFRRVSLTGSTT